MAAEQDKVIVLGMWASPFVKRVELALKLKDIPYQYVEEDLKNKSDLLLNSNPVHKKVPVLLHYGKPIAESVVILQHIDDTWKQGPKLLPDDPYQKAQVRFWCKFIEEQIQENIFAIIRTVGEAHEKAIQELYEKLTQLENGIKKCHFPDGNPYVDVKKAGLLDIMFASVFGPSKAQEEVLGIKFIDPEKFPLLFSWLTNLVELQLVKETTPPHEKLRAILQFFRQSLVESAAA